MPNDRISRYRQVRLIIDLPAREETRCHWSLIALTVRAGVPSASVIDRGWTPALPATPGPTELWEVLCAIAEDLAPPLGA